MKEDHFEPDRKTLLLFELLSEPKMCEVKVYCLLFTFNKLPLMSEARKINNASVWGRKGHNRFHVKAV